MSFDSQQRATVTMTATILRARTQAALVAAVVACVALAGAASASAGPPQLLIDAAAAPTHFSAVQDARCVADASFTVPRCDGYAITVHNIATSAAGAPVVIHDVLPAGLTVNRIAFFWSGLQGMELGTSKNAPVGEAFCKVATATCELPAPLEAGQTLQMYVYVTVGATSGALNDTATVSAAGMRTTAAAVASEASEAPAAFGVESTTLLPSGEEGAPDTTAGGHPYQLTSLINLRTSFRLAESGGGELPDSVEDVKDVALDLPLGFLGSAEAAPTCELAQLAAGGCPHSTVVGHITSYPESSSSVESPIYNMVPEQGFAAEFGYTDVLMSTHLLYAHVVPTAEGYALQTVSRDVPQVPIAKISAVFYGDPAARDESNSVPTSMFTNPTNCGGGPLTTRIYVDSWENPGASTADGFPEVADPRWVESSTTVGSEPEAADESIEPALVSGCNALTFQPSAFTVRPETGAADAPTGLNVEISVPQPEEPGTLAAPSLRDATVTLPQGVGLDPAVAEGLEACSSAQVGWLGGNLHDFNGAAPQCPDKSKLGTVELESPLLNGAVKGAIYLAQPFANPYGTRYAAYIVVDDERTGILLKIPGEVLTNEQTGQITGTFEDNPQFPFSDLKLHFFGGTRGDLTTPQVCGTFTSAGTLTPWSAPDSGPATPVSDAFSITQGCGGLFAPVFTEGAESPQAGAFSPLRVDFSRADGESNLSSVSISLPDGALAKIAGVPLCSDAALAAAAASSGAQQAASPSCPVGSQIGEATVAAGPGSSPFRLPAKVYLTGAYNGGPYGLAVVVPVVAGPFDLGTVVVRSSIRIDPHDAHVTVVSDAFPQIVGGVPVRLRQVEVLINRANFAFNPTNCSPLSAMAGFTATTGQAASAESRFAVGGCRELVFKPGFAASTMGKTSKVDGASLHVKLVPPHEGPQSGGVEEANIAKVKVELPKALPSRLTTLQKACTAVQFEANRAGCPEASVVGTAVVHTPVLNSALTGPAYFVSHGNEAFPQLIMVLQGENITVELVGDTFISKTGITSSTFKSVPDVPVSSFELTLPQGKYSALAANGNLCDQTLAMPTEFVAQNGAVIHQSTPIGVEGCPSTISIVSHAVKGRNLKVAVSAPAAGKLVLSGKGLSKASKTSKGRETLTLKLNQKRAGRLKTTVLVTFTPSAGKVRKKQSKALHVRFTK